MSKSMVSVYVRCPFYHREEKQKIFCEGVGEGTFLHLAFGSSTDKKQYEKCYCKGKYRQCPIADMQERRYCALDTQKEKTVKRL